jgi:hypothetical protein
VSAVSGTWTHAGRPPRTCPAVSAAGPLPSRTGCRGGRAGRTPTMLTSLGRSVACGCSGPGHRGRLLCRTSCHVRGDYRKDHHVSTLAGVREAVGHPSGGRPPRTPTWTPTPAWPGAGHRPSGWRSFRKQRTVNPQMVPARYNFLYPSSRPALRAASGRPPARQRHDGHRGTGLPSQQGGPKGITAADEAACRERAENREWAGSRERATEQRVGDRMGDRGW